MDPRLQRKRDLEEHLGKDYTLLREFEDKLRYESDPKQQGKLQADISALKNQIADREAEQDSLNKIPVAQTIDPQLQETVKLYLAASFDRDQFAELDQAGETDPDRSTLLQKVFIDLDVKEREGQQPRGLRREDVSQSRVPPNDRPFTPEESEQLPAMRCLLAEHWPKVVIIGGPGQGKSTLGQHLAQVHRAKLLGKPWEFEPQTGRIPFRVVLKYFAQWLTDGPALDNLETYLAGRVEKLAARQVSAEDIQDILRYYPCILILDGLDEVVAPELRERMLSRIREFLRRAEQLNTDLMIMATSRPTGYKNQFDPEQFWHLELLPLSMDKVRTFAEKWVQAKKLREEEQNRILHTLEDCQQDENVCTLLRTPLQVTIILLIVKDGGHPPSQREALFDEYWGTIFRRERSKTRGIIQSDEPILFNLHAYLGYLLHRRVAEQNVQSLLPEDEFRQVIQEFLRRQDNRSSDEAINLKMEQLVSEARDRLVMIVEPESKLFGFEYRSLQEFFAAVHLLQTATSTEQRFERLKAIARSEHWRNVALFFAGRIARLQGGETSNILELVCRPMDRAGFDRYLRRGAWLALEIAADGALGINRDLQYNVLEYGLEVLETGLTTEQQSKLKSVAEQLSPEDQCDILRPVLEEKIRSLPIACLELALDLYGQHFGATPLAQEKIDALLQAQRENTVLSALDLALQCEPDSIWMMEQLQIHWPYWKERLPEWWFRSPKYVEQLLSVWSPSWTEVLELVETVFEPPRHYYRSFPWPPDKITTWAMPEPPSPTDQLIMALRCLDVMTHWDRRPSRDAEIKLGRWGGISLFVSEESQHSLHVPDDIEDSLDNLLQRSDLMPWLREQLWILYWAINRPNPVNVSAFFEDIWTIQQAKMRSVTFWPYWSSAPWPLLAIAVERQQAKGPEAIKALLPFLDADNQLAIAKQVTEAIRECVEQSDETLQKRLLIAMRARIELDELFPQLAPLATQMGVTIGDLVYAHIEVFTYLTHDSEKLEYSVDQLRDLLMAAEESIDHSDRLSRLLWPLADGTWPSDPEVLSQAQQLLARVLDRWLKSAESSLANPSVILFLKLLVCDAQIQEVAPRLFTSLSRTEPSKLAPWRIFDVLGELSSKHLSVLESFLTHQDEDICAGAAVLWKAAIDAIFRYPRFSEDEHQEIKEYRLAPEIGLTLINYGDRIRRLTGVALLTLSDYPIENAERRQMLLTALRQPCNADEEYAWAQMLQEIPISNANRQAWCILLEEILTKPQNYCKTVLSTAMERYQSLTSTVGVALGEDQERELGLP